MAYVNNRIINDYMTTAIEGGSAYWMNEEDDCRNVRVVRDADSNVIEITCETDVDGKGWVPHKIVAKDIRKAMEAEVEKCRTGKPFLFAARQMVIDPEHDYDAGDADVVLQLAMFGDVVFG